MFSAAGKRAKLQGFLPAAFLSMRQKAFFHAIADFGGSEGIYLDCYLQGMFDDTNNRRCQMGTFKTLKTDLESMKTMAELGGILNYFLTEFVNKNIDRFMPDAARKIRAIQKLEKENQ